MKNTYTQLNQGERLARSRGGAVLVSGRRFGFTLIELMVVISIIALIAALLITGLNQASKSAKRSASQRSAAAIAQAVTQFEIEFGFLPPLVHDGVSISAGDDAYRPLKIDGNVSQDGPLFEQAGGAYTYRTVIAWSDGLDFDFFRRRNGTGADTINLSRGGSWDDDGAWEDRRYSKYALAYYLTGILDKDVDGVRGPGFARPIVDGTFLGIGYPVGASRDRYEPLMDVDRRGARLSTDYVEPNEFPEHLLDHSDPPDPNTIYNGYQEYQRNGLVAIVDSFGNAFRYYRWEPGRFVNGQLVVENQLDLNLPPVLIDPVVLAKVQNDVARLDEADLTGGDTKLRDARFAIVSAGPNGLFGTEDIKTLSDEMGVAEPTTLEDIAKLRQEAWLDNAVEVGGS
ncbi:MAG: type II secretion system protein [Phycisphaerales bacterium]